MYRIFNYTLVAEAHFPQNYFEEPWLSELSSDRFSYFMSPFSQSFAALILSSSQVLPLSTGGSLVTFKTRSREMILTSESICLHTITCGKENRVSNTRHIPHLGYTFRAIEGPRRSPSSTLDPNRREASVCKAHTSSEGGGGTTQLVPPHHTQKNQLQFRHAPGLAPSQVFNAVLCIVHASTVEVRRLTAGSGSTPTKHVAQSRDTSQNDSTLQSTQSASARIPDLPRRAWRASAGGVATVG